MADARFRIAWITPQGTIRHNPGFWSTREEAVRDAQEWELFEGVRHFVQSSADECDCPACNPQRGRKRRHSC